MLLLAWACQCAPEPEPDDSGQLEAAVPHDTAPTTEDTDLPRDTDTAPPDSPVDTDSGDTAGWSCDEPRVHEGDLYLQSNDQVETFCESWNTVSGDLTFHFGDSEDPILQLDGARCLCDVGGDLEFFYAPAVPDPDPESAGPPPPHVSTDFELVNVRTIGGDLYVHHIPGVTNLQTFRELTSVGGSIRVEDNSALTTVSFSALTELGGGLELIELNELLAVSVPELATIPGDLLLGDPDDQTWHYALTTVDLGSVTSVGGRVALRGLPVLEQVNLPLVQTIGGALAIESTCATQLDLAELSSVGSLQLQGLCGVDDFTGLSSLSQVAGDLTVSGNARLSQEEVDAFVSGLSVGGSTVAVGSEVGTCDDYWRGVWYRASTCD